MATASSGGETQVGQQQQPQFGSNFAAMLAAERVGVRTTAAATLGAAVGALRAIGEHAPMLPLAAATGLNAAMFGSTFFVTVELCAAVRQRRDVYNGGLAGGL
eukprot:SAG31_NODE_31021_length_373_cov_0.937956_1_plen_102_part_01